MRQRIEREQAEERLRQLNSKKRIYGVRLSSHEERERIKVARKAIGGDENKAMVLWLKGEIDRADSVF